MPVIVQCGACGVRLKARDELMGKRVRCRCGAAVAMPPDPTGPEVADLSGLIDELSPASASCPSCKATMDAYAVICVGCGFNKQTGKRIKSAVDESPSRKKKAPKGENGTPRPNDPVREAKKALVWKVTKFVVAAVIILGAVWFIKGAIGLNPQEQASDKLNVVFAGMTIEETVKAIGKPPREVYTTVDEKGGPLGSTTKERRIDYADNFLEVHGEEKLKYGFRFVYKFSERDQLLVHFSPEGKVDIAEVYDPMKALGL